MEENRNPSRSAQQTAEGTIWVSETLRNGAASGPGSDPEKDAREEKVSAFWRIFGGTVLSIVALAVVTVYNQLTASIAELRADVGRLNEVRGDYVKKDEYSSRNTRMWEGITELRGLQGSVNGLKERAVVRDQQTKEEGQRFESVQKDLQQLQHVVTALKERSMLRDQQVKDEEERKALLREIQTLRERLASLEGRQGAGGLVKPATHRD